MMDCAALILVLGFAQAPPAAGDDVQKLREALLAARHDFDDAAVEAIQKQLLARSDKQKSYWLSRAIAESYLFRADRLRLERTIRALDSSVVKEHRARQAEWGKAGLAHAEKAQAAASTDEEKAHAQRLVGELYVHQISGPIAGFVNGPKALASVRVALDRLPQDPECLRAQGLMYLYNPPINGGDLEAAIATFRKCSEKAPDSDIYQVYLALAYRKKGSPERAEVAARRALRLNPRNVHARDLVEELGRKQEEAKG
jgi:tetratricopeptide (TPR) repeat protein